MPPGTFWEILTASFGSAAAILLVGGWMFLRYHRDRQHFQLMHAALERGLTSLPGMIPAWLLSLRQGVLALALGTGLAAAGIALAATANHIEEAPATTQPALAQAHFQAPLPPQPDDDFPPRAQHGQFPPRPQLDRRPPPNPAMERWHRVQTQRLTGLLAICAGGILALLGLVRIAFARIEKKYATQAAETPALPER